MSDDQGKKKIWDWTNPQTVLAVVGIVVSLFGAAFALPFGQDLLCRTIGISCRHVELRDVAFAVSAIDATRFCKQQADRYAASAEPPPPGFIDGPDCPIDFSFANPPDYSSPIGAVESNPGVVLVGHFSARYPTLRADTPFTMRASCSRLDAAAQVWMEIPCELSPPRVGFDGGYPTVEEILSEQVSPVPPDAPPGTIGHVLEMSKNLVVSRWRLDIDGRTRADLPLGDYRVELAIGGPGEPVDPASALLTFNVYPMQ